MENLLPVVLIFGYRYTNIEPLKDTLQNKQKMIVQYDYSFSFIVTFYGH